MSDGELQQSLFLTGMESDAAFRTNVGLVNRGNAPVGASLTLVDGNGNTLGTSTVVVPASNFSQASLASFFPSVNGGNFASLSMRITAGAPGALSAYASVIDNRTQDPVYLQATAVRSGSRSIIPAVGRDYPADSAADEHTGAAWDFHGTRRRCATEPAGADRDARRRQRA